MFQADLLTVLSDFQISAAEDYYGLPPGDRTYFTRRLFKAFVDNQDDVHRDLLTAGGLRVHFATSGNLSASVTNVPSPAFLKKLCFYANRSLVSFPFRELSRAERGRAMAGVEAKAWRESMRRKNAPIIFGDVSSKRTGYGGELHLLGHGYSLDPAAFRDFLSTVSQLRPAIDAGLTYVLPTFPDRKRETRRLVSKLTTANFDLPELRRQFTEAELSDDRIVRFRGDLLNLYLPYFTHIPLERILEIRHREADMYSAFQRYLEVLLAGLSQAEGERKLLETLRDIDRGVRELDRKFRSVKAEYGRKDIYMGMGVLCTGLAIFAGIEWSKDVAQWIAAATGGATSMQYLSTRAEKAKAHQAIGDDKFYVPWLVYQAAPTELETSVPSGS